MLAPITEYWVRLLAVSLLIQLPLTPEKAGEAGPSASVSANHEGDKGGLPDSRPSCCSHLESQQIDANVLALSSLSLPALQVNKS